MAKTKQRTRAGEDSPSMAETVDGETAAGALAPPAPAARRAPPSALSGSVSADLKVVAKPVQTGGDIHLWLPPAAMLALSVGARDVVLVALIDQASAPSAAETPVKGSAGKQPLQFTSSSTPTTPTKPPSAPSPGSLSPLLLQHACGDAFGVVVAAAGAEAGVADSAADSDSAPAAGEFVVAARVWPMPKLPKDGVHLSQALCDSLGRPGVGATVRVLPVATSTPPRYPQRNESTATTPARTPPANGRTPVVLGECAALRLRVCCELAGSVPAGPEAARPVHAAPAPSATPSSPATPVSASTPTRPASATPRLATKSTAPFSPMTPTAKEQRDAIVNPAAGRPPVAGAWVQAALQVGGSEGAPHHRRLLQALAAKTLAGRVLAVGNVVTLPLLGHECVCRVERAAVGEAAEAAGSAIALATVGTGSAVTLLTGEGEHDEDEDGVAVDTEDMEETAASVVQLAQALPTAPPLGGMHSQLEALRELVTLPLNHPELFAQCGVRPPRGVLLYGPPGTGKTSLARKAAVDAGAKLFVVNGPELLSEYYGASEAALRDVFRAAAGTGRAVVLLDEVDALAPSRGGEGGGRGSGAGGGDDMSQRVVATLLTILDGAEGDLPGVIVLATTNRPEAVDAALRRPGRFDRELEVGVPTPAEREDILRTLLRSLNHRLADGDIRTLAKTTHGFVGADLEALCREGALVALRRLTAAPAAAAAAANRAAWVVEEADMHAAHRRVRPSGMREMAVEVPAAAWSDVGGLGDVKARLQEAVQWAHTHKEALERVGATVPRGVLLYGPPGCSKTLLVCASPEDFVSTTVRAVASESGLNFLSVKGPELFSKWVGESEKAVRALFARARAAAPSIVFFDEIDGLAASRDGGGGGGEGGTSVGERVLNQLLHEVDGFQPLHGVAVVAATNRPDLVDAALLRPGRFDRLVYVPPPTGAADRAEIFSVHLRKTPLNADVSIQGLAELTRDYTGADISSVCREAALAALEEDLSAETVAQRHFTKALQNVAASVPPESKKFYESFMRQGQQ